MIKRNQEYLNRISTIIDFVLVVFSYIFSAWFRLKVLNGWWENQGLSIPMVIASVVYAAGLLIMLFRNISTIGTLKALGMTDKGIAKVFLQVSSNLVLKGMLIGNALALLFCLIQGRTHFFKLNPENYFVSFVPVAVNVPMILLADLAAYIIIMLLLLLPSLFISKVDPAQTMRTQ